MTHTVSRRRVLLCDDDATIAEVLRDVLSVEPDLHVVGVGRTAAQAVSLAVQHEPDVAVLDLRMPGGGAHAAREIRTRSPRTRILAFSAYGDVAAQEEMRRAGASAYLLKGVPIDELVSTVRQLADGPGDERG